MQRVVRLIVALLLALALPVQGVSAAAGPACGEAHRGHAGEPAHADAGTTRHAHGSGLQHAGHAHAAAADTTRVEAPFAEQGSRKCSTCASCCVNAVVPSAAMTFDAIRAREVFAACVAGAPAAHRAERLERPPRFLLA